MLTNELPSFDFALMSDLSTRPPHAAGIDEQLEEVAIELEYRRTVYPRMVARGRMSEAESDLHIDLVAAIGDDLAFTWDTAARVWRGQRHGWEAKVRELRRELAIRRGAWPRRIASAADPMDAGAAALRMERLDALHYHYFITLFGSDPLFDRAGSPADRRDAIRALHFPRWQWMRAALGRGGCDALCVPPELAGFFADIDAGLPHARRAWVEHQEAAQRHGTALESEGISANNEFSC